MLFDGSMTLSIMNIETPNGETPLRIYINGQLCNDSNNAALYSLNMDDAVMIDTLQYCFIVKGDDNEEEEDDGYAGYSGLRAKQAPRKKCETIDDVLREVSHTQFNARHACRLYYYTLYILRL